MSTHRSGREPLTSATTSPAAGRPEVLTIYVTGLFQGLSLVAFPAAATILTEPSGYGLSKTRYGLLFVPQVVMAIAGSLALPSLARRFSLKWVLLGGLVANTISMSLLVGSVPLKADGIAYPMLLVATATLGLGFGLLAAAGLLLLIALALGHHGPAPTRLFGAGALRSGR